MEKRFKRQLTEYAKELVANARVKPATKVRKHYAHDALCGMAMTMSSDEELLEGYLKDKYRQLSVSMCFTK